MAFAETRYLNYKLTRESIIQNAPAASGVYGLFSAFWICVGEAEDLRASLLQHLESDNPCICHYRPSGFAFELAAPDTRHARRQELVRELEPMCEGAEFVIRNNIKGKSVRRAET